MLSPALSQLLERARTRFGLEVEVIDATLKHVYPDGTTALARLIEGSPDLRQSLLGALAGGRPERVDEAGANYHVFPLRRAAKVRQSSALLAVRRTDSGVADGGEAKAWPELARSMVEADFAAADALTVERQQSRRLLATLRFLSDLVETDNESALGQAIVQAAAVWFDADARIFAREITGDFVLHTALPGAQIENGATRLSSHWIGDAAAPVRVGPIPEWGHAIGESDLVLIPLSSTGPADWVLALIGTLPPEAERLFSVLGRIAAVQVETFRSKRRDRTRAAFSITHRRGWIRPRARRGQARSRAGGDDASRVRLPGAESRGWRTPPCVARQPGRASRGWSWPRRQAPLRTCGVRMHDVSGRRRVGDSRAQSLGGRAFRTRGRADCARRDGHHPGVAGWRSGSFAGCCCGCRGICGV